MNAPAPRRILLAVTGLTPQVLTETVYALACASASPWLPTEVHLITTAPGAENARLTLLGPNGEFHRLRADYDLPEIAFPPENIHVVKDDEGGALDDIRTQADNTRAADFIVDMVRALTAEADSELHVSIAGGRKTMGYYLGYALSLYGRPQDRLSHVLVSDPYESNRDFYYPTPYEKAIHIRRGSKEITVDARKAEVSLASIPFVRLREELPPRLLRNEVKLSQVVESANRALQPPFLVLELNDERRQVIADDEVIPISLTEFLVLLWFALRARNGNIHTDCSSIEMREEFIQLATAVGSHLGRKLDRKEKALLSREAITKRTPAAYFQPPRSLIKTAFEEALGKPATRRYGVSDTTRGKKGLVTLKLDPDQIEIRAPRTLRVAMKSAIS